MSVADGLIEAGSATRYDRLDRELSMNRVIRDKDDVTLALKECYYVLCERYPLDKEDLKRELCDHIDFWL
ncbi:MAG: hypothetical protein J6Y37_15865 [Paludibacteraceae bacterium]|nr:hypothetical protein [Paludibacteraceae bacterium]